MTARLVIAAPRSGEGKTSVTLGIARALAARGLAISVCKVGPDYLDTGWHSLATGRVARNLDVWTMGEQGVKAAFAKASRDADVVLVEGVMGLFDGHRTGAAECSTADVARLVDAPVVLVVDASGAGASLAALAHGFATFDPRVRVAGVVLNRFGEHRDRAGVADVFASVELPVLGWVPAASEVSLASRHLGLVQAEEDARSSAEAIAFLGELAERTCDVDGLLALARSAADLPAVSSTWGDTRGSGPVPRIAVARDTAFAFYYPDNLEALAEHGAELVEFSPLADDSLPDDVDGVYLGGGYPEMFASELSANTSMRESVGVAARRRVPIFAECGGMLYLMESLKDLQGRAHEMVAVLPARARMTGKLQRLGYVEAELADDCVLGYRGARVRGHEFRYSYCEPAAGQQPAWLVGGEAHGFLSDSIVASYLHLNFAGCPEIARDFVAACGRYRTERTR